MITALPGAVFFEVIRRQLQAGQTVMAFLIGNFAGVAIIATLALAGMSLVTEFIQQDIFYLLSGLVLVYIGAGSLLTKEFSHRPRSHRGQSILVGLALSLANPISVVFWITMVGKFYAQAAGYWLPILHSLAIVLGGILFFVLLIALLRRFGNFLRPRHTLALARVFGVVVICYGLTNIIRVFA